MQAGEDADPAYPRSNQPATTAEARAVRMAKTEKHGIHAKRKWMSQKNEGDACGE